MPYMREIPRYPICDKCNQEIHSEFRYRVDNEVFCEECFEEFVRDTFREYNEEIG